MIPVPFFALKKLWYQLMRCPPLSTAEKTDFLQAFLLNSMGKISACVRFYLKLLWAPCHINQFWSIQSTTPQESNMVFSACHLVCHLKILYILNVTYMHKSFFKKIRKLVSQTTWAVSNYVLYYCRKPFQKANIPLQHNIQQSIAHLLPWNSKSHELNTGNMQSMGSWVRKFIESPVTIWKWTRWFACHRWQWLRKKMLPQHRQV